MKTTINTISRFWKLPKRNQDIYAVQCECDNRAWYALVKTYSGNHWANGETQSEAMHAAMDKYNNKETTK